MCAMFPFPVNDMACVPSDSLFQNFSGACVFDDGVAQLHGIPFHDFGGCTFFLVRGMLPVSYTHLNQSVTGTAGAGDLVVCGGTVALFVFVRPDFSCAGSDILWSVFRIQSVFRSDCRYQRIPDRASSPEYR